MAVKINTNKQLRAIKNEIAKKSTTSMSKMIIDKNGLRFELTKAVGNKLEIEKNPKFVLDGKTEIYVEDFTDTIVSVEFRPSGSKNQKQRILGKSALFQTVAIKFDGAYTDVVSIANTNNGLFGYSFRDKARRKITLDGLIESGYSLYIAGAYSASEARKNSTTLYKCKKSSEVARKIDELTYGAFNNLLGSPMTLEDSQKIASRMGQWKTGMTHTDNVDLVTAFYVGKWSIGDTEHADGKAYLQDTKVATVLSNHKYEITRNAVEGLLIQNRPFSVCKTEGKVTNSDYIYEKVMFDVDDKEENVVFLNREEINRSIQKEFDKIFIKGSASIFDGKVVIIKSKSVKDDIRAIEYYTDLNGIKCSYDLKRDSGLNILAIDKPLKGGVVNTNMQQIESLAMADANGTKETMKDVAIAFNKKSMHEALSPQAKVPSMKDMEQLYTAGIVKSIAPEYALQNQKIFGTIAEQALKGMVKAARGLNYKVPGQSRIVQMDFASDFGEKILPAGTCYAPGINERLIFATRAPKMHTGEYLLLTNLTKKEVLDLIDQSNLSKKQKRAVKREYRLLSESAVVIPSYEDYKDTTGGMDFDGDVLAITVFRKFSKILKNAMKAGKINSTAIKVKGSKVNQEKDMTFSLTAIHTAFVKLINNGNLSIGEVTFMNNFLLGLLFELKNNGSDEAAKEFFKFAGNRDGKESYIALPRQENGEIGTNSIEVSFEIMDEIVASIKQMELTRENMINALDDLNAVFMMLQMETIDAAKKGTTVPVPFEGMLNDFQQASKTKLDIDLGISVKEEIENSREEYQEVDGVKYLVETRSGWNTVDYDSDGAPVERFFHQDLLHEVRLGAARDVMRSARLLRRKYNAVKFDETVEQFFISAQDAVDQRLINDLIELKFIFNSINAGINIDETQEPHYKAYLQALANTVRSITSHMDDVARAELVEAISAPSATNNSKHSSFAMATVKEEYIKMIAQNFAEINVAGERITHQKNIEEGDVLNFAFGVAKDGDKIAVVKGDISGEFVVTKVDDNLYATKDIMDVIPQPELTNDIVFRASGDNLDQLKDELLAASNVELKIVFGKGDQIIADGKVVGKFITNPGMASLNRLYEDSEGTVKNVMITEEFTRNGGRVKVLIGVLECSGVPKLSNPEEQNIIDGEAEVSDEAIFS